MKIVKQSHEIIDRLDEKEVLKKIEMAGRLCYKSEDKITDISCYDFVERLLNQYKHESVIEHFSFSVKFTTDRGVSHELVRHRLASFSQESTRYCNYHKDKFGSEITIIQPSWLNDEELRPFLNKESIMSHKASSWYYACMDAEAYYFDMIKSGATPQEARAVLPNSLKTEIFVSANIREWRHILKLRTGMGAHPDIKLLMNGLKEELIQKLPLLFKV